MSEQPGPSAQDYLDAAAAAMNVDPMCASLSAEHFARDSSLIAAVDSAFAAGWLAGHAAGYDDGSSDGFVAGSDASFGEGFLQ